MTVLFQIIPALVLIVRNSGSWTKIILSVIKIVLSSTHCSKYAVYFHLVNIIEFLLGGRFASMGWGGKTKGRVPDRWEVYSNIGQVVEGTRFIPFKVPLNEFLLKKVGPGVDRWDLDQLVQDVPQLGLVVDLTNTSR